LPDEEDKGKEIQGHENLSERMWDLDTDTRIKNLTWWWWWWIFFIKNPKDPEKTRQLMILWSTKNCERIFVDDYLWERTGDIERSEASSGKKIMKFDGMVAVWWFDGEKMHDPYALERSHMDVEWVGNKGFLKPRTENTYLYAGNPDKYRIAIQKDGDEFDFRVRPWTEFMSEHRFSEGKYVGKMGYNIYKIYGSKLDGSIRIGKKGKREEIEGTAYFQKVMVNAPAVPWYWGLFHTDNGSYIDYMLPHWGFPIRRRTEAPTSFWDRCYFYLSRNLQFYDAATGTRHRFPKKGIRVKKEINDGLPTFFVTGKDRDKEISFTVKAHSRAYWRFEQKYLKFFTSILYYNEYPSRLTEFLFKDGERKVTLEDLGHVSCNTEHSWGWLV
jgi:hypothetical protein